LQEQINDGKNTIFDEGSFRDPEGRVFRAENERVYRTLSDSSVQRMQRLLSSNWFEGFVGDGRICPTSIEKNRFNCIESKYLLQHERMKPIVCPCEFSFEMLKDAALLTLDIMLKCLEHELILKDGSAWNVTVYKGKMCFFDILSIDSYQEGQVWNGYGQFCQEFLYPLLLKSQLGIDFQPFLKSSLKGVDIKIIANMISPLRLLKTNGGGALKHVFLRNFLERTAQGTSVKGRFSLPKAGLIKLIRSMKSFVLKLKPKSKYSVWLGYDEDNSYRDRDVKAKEAFISEYFDRTLKTLIDLGCNTGHYSFLASRDCKVIACDFDGDCIDVVYKKSASNVVPVVLDLMNPSPSCGWGLTERKSIYERLGHQDGFLALALIHHICIVNNVPLEFFIKQLKSLASSGVLEWISKDDPMVQVLLRNRDDVFIDYTWENFEAVVSKHFKIIKIQDTNNGTRTLCMLESA
jgi:SAM-dependent methyltransferase